MGQYLQDFPDLVEALEASTRGDRSIDRIFLNLQASSAGTLPPLETDVVGNYPVSKKSDHLFYHDRKSPEGKSFVIQLLLL